jgi:hypothetical protein
MAVIERKRGLPHAHFEHSLFTKGANSFMFVMLLIPGLSLYCLKVVVIRPRNNDVVDLENHPT